MGAYMLPQAPISVPAISSSDLAVPRQITSASIPTPETAPTISSNSHVPMSLLQGAQNVYMQQPTITMANNMFTADRSGRTRRQILAALSENLLPRAQFAEYDAASPAPRNPCTTNAGNAILDTLQAWASDNTTTNVYWLNGTAGTGKTTIAYSFSAILDNKKSLGGTFFSSHLRADTSDVRCIIPTICFQLAKYLPIPSLSQLILDEVEADPDCKFWRISKQFLNFIVRPLTAALRDAGEVVAVPVIILDALDECSDQSLVAELLFVILKYSTSLPVKFFITSRPEKRLKESFDKSVDMVVCGAIGGLYSINGKVDPDVEKVIPQLKVIAGFRTGPSDYVKASKFKRFFPSNDPLLQTLAMKANTLREGPSTDLGKPENIERLTRLSLYQLVIYCDDSGSMEYDQRYRNQRDLVTRIARVATKIVPDDMAGVDLRFINSASSERLDASAIEHAIDAVAPGGTSKIGTQLRERILKPLVYDAISTSKLTTSSIPFKRPLLVCVITDGCPYPEPNDTLVKAVLECKQKLEAAGYDPTAVIFLISQIGTDPEAARFLNDLMSEPRIQDVVYVTAEILDKKYGELKENERELELWLLHLLTGPIMDRRED